MRYLRISHRLPWPYDERYGGLRYENVALSEGLSWTPVEVLGTVPVEADGSAHFRVPVDTPVYFQLLDENYMELRRMRSFISFQPGEQRSCVGCHESKAVAPTQESGLLAFVREPSVPAPPPWGVRPLNFLRDIQPVFDRHCVTCHGGLKPAESLDLHGRPDDGRPFQDALRRRTRAGRPQHGLPHTDYAGPGRLQQQVRSGRCAVLAAGVRFASQQADRGTARRSVRQTGHAQRRRLAAPGHLGRRERAVPQPLPQHAAGDTGVRHGS